MKKKRRKPGTPAPKKGKKNERPFALTWVVLLGLAVLALGVFYFQKCQGDNQMSDNLVVIETEKGDIVLEVYPDLMPITVENFLGLVGEGFYDGLVWHRVEDWVIQTGDPLGTGYGGSEKTIPLEIGKGLSNKRGYVGMARSQDPNSASSQFYILKRDSQSLDGSYAIFAKVTEGMDVVDRLEMGDKMVRAALKATP